MAIALTGTGGLFTRLGKLGALLNAVNLFRGTGAILITSIQRAANVATVTTNVSHGYTTGDTVTIAGVTSDTVFNTTGASITVTGLTTFTYANVAANAGPFTNQGTTVKTGGVGYFAVGPYCDNIVAQFQSTNQQLVDGLYSDLDAYRRVHGSFLNKLKKDAEAVLIKMANDDFPLSSKTVTAALQLLIDQMINSAASVNASTVAVGSQTAFPGITNVGNPVIVTSTKRGDGKNLEYLIPETVLFVCTADSISGGATARGERWSVKGQNVQSDMLSWDWPGGAGYSPYGSGGSISLTSVDAQLDNSGGNLLQNGDFETFTTANVADNWTILVGTAGADFGETATSYTGSKAAKFFGGTAVNTAITQKFNQSPSTTVGAGGTSYNITTQASVPFAVNLFIKADVVPASGVITVDLVDGSNTTINDDAGTANSFTITLNAITTSYAAKNGVFRLPTSIPSTGVKLRIRASTVIPGGTNIFIDDVGFAKMTPLYRSGPYLAIFSGATKPVVNDSWTVAFTNVAGRFQRLFQQFFNLPNLAVVSGNGSADGAQLPSSGAPTIADSLIA